MNNIRRFVLVVSLILLAAFVILFIYANLPGTHNTLQIEIPAQLPTATPHAMLWRAAA